MILNICEEFLLHDVAVTLYDTVLRHIGNRGQWVIRLRFSPFRFLYWTAERTLFACQIAIHIIARLLVKALQWNVEVIHISNLLILRLAYQTAIIDFLQRCFGSFVYCTPQCRDIC